MKALLLHRISPEMARTRSANARREPKQMYCEPLSDTVVCGGVYKF
jgi:hypothetical protein